MTDVNTIAARYIDLWNERSAARRRELLAANWANNATYVDPIMSGDGHGGIDALIEGVQKRFPDFRFKLLGKVDGYGNQVRFSWGLGPDGAADSPIKGTDIAVIADEKIRSITGFLDLDAAHFQADTEFQIGGHQRAAILLDDGLDIPEHRLQVARCRRQQGDLTGLQKAFAMTDHFHCRLLGVLPLALK